LRKLSRITWPIPDLQITRYTSLNEAQLLGCTSAFVDSLFGALNTAVMYLRKLEGQRKGNAFAFEMQMDQARYGSLLILERWALFLSTFAPHAQFPKYEKIVNEGPARVSTAEEILRRTNDVLDASPDYSAEVVAAAVAGFHSLRLTFEEESAASQQALALGPMLSEDFKECRRVFLVDLAAR